MSNHKLEYLKNLKPQHQFFIGIDSDGCAFDSMEIKHKECFIPPFIKYFDLQPISKFAREAAEFTNLYSKSRGANRFLAYLEALELLANRKEVISRNFIVKGIAELKSFVKSGNNIDNSGLQKFIENNPQNAQLKKILDWSLTVNKNVKDIVHNVAPFPLVSKSLEKARETADVLVVSSTPEEALNHEWKEANISQFVSIIAGQETGTKKDVLNAATKDKYKPNNILMIGDAPGDFQAAQANAALFYPINPGFETESWERFYDEAFGKFIEGSFVGDYQKKLLREFDSLLPDKPNWK